MNENMARETIKRILQDPLLKEGKKKVFVKLVYPKATTTLRNYMLILLTKEAYLDGNQLVNAFVINLGKGPSNCIGISKHSYITKPTMADYFEMSSSYRTYKNRTILVSLY
jgi:hypothetical protein